MDFFGNLPFFLSSYPLRNWMPVCMDCTVIWPLGQKILSIPPDLRCWWKIYSCGLPGGWKKPRLMTHVLSFKSLLILRKLSFGISIYLYIYMWIFIHEYIYSFSDSQDLYTSKLGFPGGSDGKESACNEGDLGSTPGSGRSPGEGNGNPLQYSCLENPMDRGTCRHSPCGRKESDMTKQQTYKFKNWP